MATIIHSSFASLPSRFQRRFSAGSVCVSLAPLNDGWSWDPSLLLYRIFVSKCHGGESRSDTWSKLLLTHSRLSLTKTPPFSKTINMQTKGRRLRHQYFHRFAILCTFFFSLSFISLVGMAHVYWVDIGHKLGRRRSNAASVTSIFKLMEASYDWWIGYWHRSFPSNYFNRIWINLKNWDCIPQSAARFMGKHRINSIPIPFH